MLKNLKEFHYPEKISDAVTLLDKLGPRAAVVAGGTTVTRMANPTVEAMVDISRLKLSYIKETGKDIRIGAGTTFQEIATSPVLKNFAGGLASKASSLVSTRLVRNMGTIGGDIVAAFPYNDLPVVLLALDASVVIVSKKEERVVPFARMMEAHPWRFVGKRALLTEVRLPQKMAAWGSSYQRFARTFSEWEASVIVAAAVERDNGSCRSARIAVGAVTRRAMRFPEAERLLAGRRIDRAAAEEAASSVAQSLDPLSDWRSSKEYRRDVARTLVARALQEAFASDAQ
jgi:aerobic carbon-monoxide dehydrogenase medium subunit